MLAGVLEVVGLDVVGEVEEDGERDRQQGHDHDWDADEVVGPGEVGGRLEGGGADGPEDPVDKLWRRSGWLVRSDWYDYDKGRAGSCALDMNNIPE